MSLHTNKLKNEQRKFLQYLVDTEWMCKHISRDVFNTYKKSIGNIEWDRYEPINFHRFFHRFMVVILKQGRYGNQLDKRRLQFIRELYMYVNDNAKTD